jgi:hypothetical protein
LRRLTRAAAIAAPIDKPSRDGRKSNAKPDCAFRTSEAFAGFPEPHAGLTALIDKHEGMTPWPDFFSSLRSRQSR